MVDVKSSASIARPIRWCGRISLFAGLGSTWLAVVAFTLAVSGGILAYLDLAVDGDLDRAASLAVALGIGGLALLVGGVSMGLLLFGLRPEFQWEADAEGVTQWLPERAVRRFGWMLGAARVVRPGLRGLGRVEGAHRVLWREVTAFEWDRKRGLLTLRRNGWPLMWISCPEHVCEQLRRLAEVGGAFAPASGPRLVPVGAQTLFMLVALAPAIRAVGEGGMVWPLTMLALSLAALWMVHLLAWGALAAGVGVLIHLWPDVAAGRPTAFLALAGVAAVAALDLWMASGRGGAYLVRRLV